MIPGQHRNFWATCDGHEDRCFRPIGWGTGRLRGAQAAGIRTQVGNHTVRATGITVYLKNGGSLVAAGS
jgi:hypothetical protein